MRKTILIPGLLLALCLLLGGCVKTVDAPQPDKTCAQWADAVQAAADFRELTDMTEKHLEKNLLISVDDLEDWVMRRDASRVTPEMILIVKVKAGADQGATGENAIRITAESADLILAPIGMLLCDGILGEVTDVMAAAIGRSKAHKILVPSARCGITVAGTAALPMSEYISQAVRAAVSYIQQREE